MSTVTGRKKSIISTHGIQLDMALPIPNNNILNKAATASLYQRCSALRQVLLRVRDFQPYFDLPARPDARKSTDIVSLLWDCFSTGISLCYLYNLLPPPSQPIQCDTDPTKFDNGERTKKHAIAKFIIASRSINEGEGFTVTDLVDRANTDGFVKVVHVVENLIERLPQDVYTESPPSPPPSLASYESTDSLAASDSVSSLGPPATAKEAARNNIIREMVETERKYVQDLEVMQKYANALSQSGAMDKDTIHLLFPNLNKLLNFQRKFLIRFEGTAEMPWPQQHWGQHFMECEEEFAVYEPYCGNYTNASDLMLNMESLLASQNHLINAKSELPAFLIKPVQRICKYPLLLDSLIKAAGDYPLIDELKEGSAAAKRITDKINEAQRRAENQLTVKNLEGRVEDWKGHHLLNFGELLLDDIFVVTKSDVDREYHVFLFEKIILCCKETVAPTQSGRKVGKSNSILKKQSAPPPLQLPGGVGPPKKKNTPLLLKGRIFLNNVTQAVPHTRNAGYQLAVWWSGEDDLEYFTLRCRTDEQLRQWEAQINRLIREIASRRVSERSSVGRMTAALANPNSTSPMPHYRMPPNYPPPDGRFSNYTNGTNSRAFSQSSSPYGSEEQLLYGYGSQGYPPQNGFDIDPDDEYEDYPPASLPSSGRGTPMGRRNTRGEQWDEGPANGYRTSGYASNGMPPPPPPPVNGLPAAPAPHAAQRPSLTRLSSTTSGGSFGSEASFGPGVKARPTLRSKFSTTKLNSAYEDGPRTGTPTPAGLPGGPVRSRSASQPSAYMPRQGQVPPPLPTATPWVDRGTGSTENKRGSGSSESTGSNSDYSPHSSSPITPYGSSDSSLGGSARGSQDKPLAPPVKVKVHFHEDIFVIQVPRATEYGELVEKVGKKIRLCGPRRDDGPLRVKYKDEDGDMVSLGSTEDVQMAFEAFHGGQVTLYVT